MGNSLFCIFSLSLPGFASASSRASAPEAPPSTTRRATSDRCCRTCSGEEKALIKSKQGWHTFPLLFSSSLTLSSVLTPFPGNKTNKHHLSSLFFFKGLPTTCLAAPTPPPGWTCPRRRAPGLPRSCRWRWRRTPSCWPGWPQRRGTRRRPPRI